MEFISCAYDLVAECTIDKSLLEQPEETEVMINVEMNRTAELKEEAIKLADEGDVSGAATIMKGQHKILSSYIQSAPIEYQHEIQEEVDKISSSLSSLAENNYDAGTRKKMSYESYQRRRNQK